MYNQQNQFQYGGSSSSTATGFQGQQAGGFGFGGANTGNVGGPGGAFSGAGGFQQMGGLVTSPRGSQTPAFGAAASGVASSTAEKAKDLAVLLHFHFLCVLWSEYCFLLSVLLVLELKDYEVV